MALSLTACGTSTLKSLLSLGPDAPHVHLRLRKRLSRCTLDCGSKTSESPALRGFEAERCPITGTSLYLVLKSNGLRHSKNPPVRFSFSLKIVPATIAKKLPLQLRPKPLFIAFFNFSHKRPTFAFAGESGHTCLRHQDRTQRHTRRNRGRFGRRWYHYSQSVPHVHQHPRAGYQNGKFCRFWVLVGDAPEERRKPTGQRCAYARRCSEGVAAPLGCVIFSISVEIAACMPCAQGLSVCARRGVVSLPSARFTCC